MADIDQRISNIPCLIASVALIAGCGSSSSRGPSMVAPDPRLFGLEQRDLVPAGFRELNQRYWSNTELARRTGISIAAYDQHGSVRAFESNFGRLTKRGLAQIANLVYVYKSPDGARWQMSELVAYARKRHYVPVSLSGFGKESKGFSYHLRFNGLTGTTYVMYFREGVTVVAVAGAGKAGTVSSSQIRPLADIIDRRILSYGSS